MLVLLGDKIVCFNSEDAVGLEIEVDVPDFISLNNSVELALFNLCVVDDTFGEANDEVYSGFGELIRLVPDALFSAKIEFLPEYNFDYDYFVLILMI